MPDGRIVYLCRDCCTDWYKKTKGHREGVVRPKDVVLKPPPPKHVDLNARLKWMLEKQFEESRNVTASKQKRYIRAAPKEDPGSLSGTRRIIDRAKRIRRRKIAAGAIKSLFMDQEGKCVFCKEPLIEYHVDHIIAVARGGDDREENLQLLCPRCNLAKGGKDPAKFMLERGIITKKDLFLLSGRRPR